MATLVPPLPTTHPPQAARHDSHRAPCPLAPLALELLRFGAREGRIMQALWAHGELSLADLHLLLADPAVNESSLRSALEKLHLKRLLRLRRVHRTCFYRASLDQASFIRILSAQLHDFLGDTGMVRLFQASRP